MTVETFDRSTNEDQIYSQNQLLMTDYLEEIKLQAATISPKIEPDDVIDNFVRNYLHVTDNYNLDDNSIYVDPRLDNNTILDMVRFIEDINGIFDTTFGISLQEIDMQLIYSLYQVLIVQFKETLIYYLNGLQQLDSDFDEDLPDYEKVSLEYYKKNNPGIDNMNEYDLVDNYLDYVTQNHIYTELFFQLALLESPGNLWLGYLYNESANNRLNTDNEFFALKIDKILSSEIRDHIINRFIDVSENISIVSN